jgi:hypothetical protein
LSLLHAESVLFIDDYQTEFVEVDLLLQKRVSSYQ